MSYITKIDLARQVKLYPNDTALLSGSTFIMGGFTGGTNSQFFGRVKGFDAIESDEFITSGQISGIFTGITLDYVLHNGNTSSVGATIGDLTVQNLFVGGSATTVDSQIVTVSANTITLNQGEVGAGVTNRFAGLVIDRGTQPDYEIVFDENFDTLVAGISGNTKSVAFDENVIHKTGSELKSYAGQIPTLTLDNYGSGDSLLTHGNITIGGQIVISGETGTALKTIKSESISGYSAVGSILDIQFDSFGAFGASQSGFLGSGCFLTGQDYTKVSKGLFISQNFTSTGVIPSDNAAIYIDSTTRGLRHSQLTYTQRNAITPGSYSIDAGLMVYQKDTGGEGEGIYILEQDSNWKKLAFNADLNTGFVPYTGATQDVNLGTNDLFLGENITLDSLGSQSTIFLNNSAIDNSISGTIEGMRYNTAYAGAYANHTFYLGGHNAVEFHSHSSYGGRYTFFDALGGATPYALIGNDGTLFNTTVGFNNNINLNYDLNTSTENTNYVLVQRDRSITGSTGEIQRLPLSGFTLDSNVVHKTGNETIAGIKTFNDTYTGTTGIQRQVNIFPTISQTSSAGFSAMSIYPYITSAGNGGVTLIDVGVSPNPNGVGVLNPVFAVQSNGNIFSAGRANITGSVTASVLTTSGTGVLTQGGIDGVGQLFNFPGATLRSDAYAGSATTLAVGAIGHLGISTFQGTSPNTLTYTIGSTLFIDGAPLAGSFAAITNPYSLYVKSGSTYFGGVLMANLAPSNPTDVVRLMDLSGFTSGGTYNFTGTTSQYVRGDGSYATFPTGFTETSTLNDVTSRGNITDNDIEIKSPGSYKFLDSSGTTQFSMSYSSGYLKFLNSSGGTIFQINQSGDITAGTYTEF